MKMRSIKRSPSGSCSRSKVRTVIQAVHVLETAPGGWEVRTLGEKGSMKRFEAKASALEYALAAKPRATVLVHQRQPKKVTVARAHKTGNRLIIREVDFS